MDAGSSNGTSAGRSRTGNEPPSCAALTLFAFIFNHINIKPYAVFTVLLMLGLK